MGVERIQAYHMGFYLCLGVTVLGVMLAVIFYFALQIKEAWRMSFGRKIYAKEKGKGDNKNAKEATDVIVCSGVDGQSDVRRGGSGTDGNGNRDC